MPNVSLEEAAAKAGEIVAHGGMYWQKFTCVHCGNRQTMEVPCVLFMHGECKKCGKDTCIHEVGCGLLMTMQVPIRLRTEEIKNGHRTAD